MNNSTVENHQRLFSERATLRMVRHRAVHRSQRRMERLMESIGRIKSAEPLATAFEPEIRRLLRESPRDKRLVVIVPCFNEKDSIVVVVTRVRAALGTLSG